MRRLFLILSLLEFCFVSSAVAQSTNTVTSVFSPGKTTISEAGVLFLMIQPSLRANGMAGASVSSIANDPIAVAFNPAHLSHLARDNYFAVEFYPTKTDWLPTFGDLNYDVKTVYLGYNLRRLHKPIPISFGLGYSRVFLDLGEQTVTDETGNELGTYHSSERANLWTVGIGIDYLVKAGIGWNFKSIKSDLSDFGAGSERGDGRAKANAHDFGIVAYLPINEVFAKHAKTSLDIRPGLYPILGVGFGYSKSNIGDAISYIDAAQVSPLPRTARIGLSLNAGLAYSRNEVQWRLLAFEIINEAEQILVRGNPDGRFRYLGGIGDIDFWENVVKAKGLPEDVIRKKGWELSFFEIFSLRGGHHEDPSGRVDYHSRGIGISLMGVFKAIRFFDPTRSEDRLFSHLDIQFNTSSWDIESEHPLEGTTFSGIKITIY